MGFVSEFKEFALKGNVMDLAIGVIIGGAFQKIVDSLVADILMPILGVLMGGTDFTKLAITVGEAHIKYGNFIQAIITFFMIAMVLFMIIKALNKMRK